MTPEEAFDREYAKYSRDKQLELVVEAFEKVRNLTLDEVAREFDKMAALGDTAASFAAFVRGMKR